MANKYQQQNQKQQQQSKPISIEAEVKDSMPQQSFDSESEKTSLELLVEGIRVRQELANKNPNDFPSSTRTGLVSAQQEARDSLAVLERQYAQYLKNSAVATILMGPQASVHKFLHIAQDVSREPLLILAADAFYRRLAAVAEPALGPSRQFGSGQVGLIIEEFAAIGKELSFTSLASPNWSYDIVVKDETSLMEVIRKAIRTSKDEDVVNRSFLRYNAFKKALELGYTSAMVPVVIVNASQEEIPFLSRQLFNASVLVNMPTNIDEISEDFVKSVFKTMVQAGKAYIATQQVQSFSL